MIKLRNLENKDAVFMLEWMHDESLTYYFAHEFMNMTLENTLKFINTDHGNSKHFTIVSDETDEYLGTVSLKSIDLINKNAEYAISLRSCAISKGIAKAATHLILIFAFEELELEKVYLNVLSENKRAVRFYEKFGFHLEGEFIKHSLHRGELKDLKWFAAYKEDYS